MSDLFTVIDEVALPSTEDGEVYETSLDTSGDGALSIREVFASSVAGIDATIESLTNTDVLRDVTGSDVLIIRGQLDGFFENNRAFFDANLGLPFQSTGGNRQIRAFANRATEDEITSLKERLSDMLPGQENIIQDMSAFELAQTLKAAFIVFESNDENGFNAAGIDILYLDGNVTAKALIFPSEESFTWENFMEAQYFDESINFPYDDRLAYIAVLGHEIEHLTQGELIDVLNKSNIAVNITNNVKELDADVGAMEMMRPMFATEAEANSFFEFYDAARIMKGFGRTTSDYMHGSNGALIRENGELQSPEEIMRVTQSVFDEVSKIMRDYGHDDRIERMDERLSASHGENLFILKQMSMSDDYTPQQQAFIGEAIEAFELIGITPVDIREPLPEAEAARATEARSELNTAFDNARQDSVPEPEDVPAPLAPTTTPETAPVPQAPSV